MIKEKRILSYFVGWLFLGYIIFIIGTNNVYAASYTGFDYTAKLYDNVNGNLTSVTTSGPYNEGLYEGYIAYAANSSGGAWLISSPITLVANHTYSLTASIPNECGPLVLSTVNRIGVGTNSNNAKASYQNNTDVIENYSRVVGGTNFLIQFAFTPTINGSYIVFPFATSVSCGSSQTILANIVIDDLGINSATQEQINTSLNNQTNTINNSIQNSTDTIINNQNQNNEELKDTINDNFNSCRDSYNLLYTPYTVDNKLTDTAIRDDYFSALNYYATLQAGKTYTFSVETDGQFGSGTGDTVEVLLLKGPNYTYYITMTSNPFTFIPQETGDFYIRYDINQNGKTHSFWNFQIVEGSSSKKWEQAGVQVCQNKIDETNDKLDGIQGALTDSSLPNTSDLENSAGWLPAGPLDSILNLPLTMLNSLTNSLGKTCSPLNLTLPYVNKNIQIPCLSAIFAQITGVNSLWTWVGTIASVLILYNYLLNLYAWVDRVLTLRAEFDEAMGADMANWGRL